MEVEGHRRLFITTEKPYIINKPEYKFETCLFLPEGEGRKGDGGLRTKGYFKHSYRLNPEDNLWYICDTENNPVKPAPGEIQRNIREYLSTLQNKENITELPLISVITVVLNGEKFLEETIRSVINQTYPNVEYIVIDGGSNDGTIDIIRKYEDYIDYWVSEKDKGIYDAMNKGIDLMTGMWVNFMNAGDSFCSSKVLSEIFIFNEISDAEIIYGNHIVVYPDGKKKPVRADSLKNLWKGNQFSHQAAFILSSVHKVNRFNVHNQAADFEFFYTSYRKNLKFKYLDVTVVNYLAGGISDRKRMNSILSSWSVVEKNIMVNLYYMKRITEEIIKEMLKKII